MTRTVLVTGKGGVGKTTFASATAVHTARAGVKTLVVSVDPAHSLGDVLGRSLEHHPVEVDAGLWAAHLDTRLLAEERWSDLHDYVRSLLGAVEVDSVVAEEITVLPGVEELLGLLELKALVESGAWDFVVVDCSPTAETLRLLALPEAAKRLIRMVFPEDNAVLRSLRPMFARASGLPVPSRDVAEALDRFLDDVTGLASLLTGPDTTLRLAFTPESVVLAETRRLFTSLSVLGFRVDGALANRITPITDFASPREQARRGLVEEARQAFAPAHVWEMRERDAEPIGFQALAAFGAKAYAGQDPMKGTAIEPVIDVSRVGEDYVMRIPTPLADHTEVGLVRIGDDVTITLGSARRIITLPSALRRCDVRGATVRDGRLSVRFVPQPSLFPSQTNGSSSRDDDE
jgi:arsenite/tail-anchored protein-transporting ATPase